jgi:hypothetical protein
VTPAAAAINWSRVSPDDPRDPVIEALWERVLAAWDDDRVHAAVIEHGLRTQSLPEVARRYRALVSDPNKGGRAQKKLDAIVVSATELLFSQKTPSPGKVPLPVTMSAFGVCAALLAWLAWAMWGKR